MLVSFHHHTHRLFRTVRTLRTFNQCRTFAKRKKKKKTSEAEEIILSLSEVQKRLLSGRTLLENVRLSFYQGSKIGIQGANGSGKTSLLKIIGGVDQDFDGKRWIKDDISVGYLPQEPTLDPTKDVRTNVLDGVAQDMATLDRFDQVSIQMGEPDADFDALLEEQAMLLTSIESKDLWDLPNNIDSAMAALRCPPPTEPVHDLSGGEVRRVALCRLLVANPDILLLDEPTNHLDASSVAWLEAYLKDYKGLVISITHDRYFLDQVAGWILEVERGQTIPFKGNYSKWLESKHKRLNLGKKKEALQAKRLSRELDWIRKNPKGGKGRNQARVSQYEAMKEENDQNSIEDRFLGGEIMIPNGPRLGNKVLKVQNLGVSFDGRELFKNIDFELRKGDVVGIVGGNGSGKSTLLKTVAGAMEEREGKDGEERKITGTVELGPTTKLSYVSQNREGLNDKHTVYESVSQGVDEIRIGDRMVNVRAYAASFNLKGAMQEKLVESLSGGERNRVHLARTLLEAPNVLLLDEPSNDLDVDTLRSLEEAVQEFAAAGGAVIVISHDRWMLSRTATRIFSMSNNTLSCFDGGWMDYEASLNEDEDKKSNDKGKFNKLSWY
jgi:sulfate-transporting ATPase